MTNHRNRAGKHRAAQRSAVAGVTLTALTALVVTTFGGAGAGVALADPVQPGVSTEGVQPGVTTEGPANPIWFTYNNSRSALEPLHDYVARLVAKELAIKPMRRATRPKKLRGWWSGTKHARVVTKPCDQLRNHSLGATKVLPHPRSYSLYPNLTGFPLVGDTSSASRVAEPTACRGIQRGTASRNRLSALT